MKDIVKKVLSVISKVLLEKGVERNTRCIYCNGKLSGSQRKFCSDYCNNKYWRNIYKAKRLKKKRILNLILMKGGLNK